MKADESKNRELDRPSRYAERLTAVLAAGCCVLPIAIMFLSGLLARWVSSLGISDVVWSWIALGAFAAVVAAVFLRLLWNRRAAAKAQAALQCNETRGLQVKGLYRTPKAGETG